LAVVYRSIRAACSIPGYFSPAGAAATWIG